MARLEAVLVLALLAAGCRAEAVSADGPWQAGAVERLAAKRVYFGHMSVGFNVADGLREVAEEAAPGRLRVVESSEAAALDRPGFAHGRNGRNGDPSSKIAGFVATMDAGVGERADVALFKFCFVDVTAARDARALFAEYRAAMEELRRRHPRLTIVHVTVPLTTVQRGWKAAVKKALGRAPDGYLDDLRRSEYNALLREAYAGREPVFDLAEAESVGPSGQVEEFTFEGRHLRALAPEYSSDGGHLNALGRRAAARALLRALETP